MQMRLTRKRIKRLVIVAAISLLSTFTLSPMVWAGRLTAETTPLPLTDADNGGEIDSYVINPRYTGPREIIMVPHPFIYKAGQKFAPVQHNATCDYFADDPTFDGITV